MAISFLLEQHNTTAQFFQKFETVPANNHFDMGMTSAHNETR
jgi:hypothetical protein